jgi:hypothetical protein
MNVAIIPEGGVGKPDTGPSFYTRVYADGPILSAATTDTKVSFLQCGLSLRWRHNAF